MWERGKTIVVPIEDVLANPQCPTHCLNKERVDYYRAKIRNGEEIDPLSLQLNMVVRDGNHRRYAFILERIPTVKVQIRRAY